MGTIPTTDPRHAAAMEVLNAMHKFFDLEPCAGAVRWIQDTTGRVVIFTRGEFRDTLIKNIDENFHFRRFEVKADYLGGVEEDV